MYKCPNCGGDFQKRECTCDGALAESAGSARWEQLAKYASVAELGAINANVMEYMRHWEQRAETAEKLARDIAACGDPKPWKKDKWAWAKSQLHPADDPNHCHPFDCGYTVTGHIHNCDCKPNEKDEL